MSDFVRNAWYVAAWAHELDEAPFIGRTLIGEPLILFRQADGGIAALADRCCHRQAPLTRGRREGDCIRCMYHGLLFDAAGECREVPGQTVVPRALRVRGYPAVEHNRWVWVWMGDPARADIARLPDTGALGDPDAVYLPGYACWDVDQRLVVDNLVDFSHLSFVHENTLGGTIKIAEARPDVTRRDDGVGIDWWVFDVPPPPFHQGVREYDGHVDRWFVYDFTLPGVLTMTHGVQQTGTGAREGAEHPTRLVTRSCQAVMPETGRSTHYFFASPHRAPDPDGALARTIFNTLETAFAEDYAMIRAQQERVDDGVDTRMMALPLDGALVHMRRLVEKLTRAEAAEAIGEQGA